MTPSLTPQQAPRSSLLNVLAGPVLAPVLHAFPILLGSFLLFQVQPVIGRFILPWFGGSPAVWTTCMLFFQVALLAGYGYAHAVTALPRRTQGIIHLVLLAAAVLCLPITPDPATWKPQPGAEPLVGILLLLSVSIGLPYTILAANAPLLQHWFVQANPGKIPYRLYALSNGASLLALLTYPVVIEPHLTLAEQSTIWSWLFLLYALGCAACALAPAAEAVQGSTTTAKDDVEPRPKARTLLLWLLLSACGSALLLATTNQLCQEVAVVPFLWVVPLALYLGTFIVCFIGERAYDRILWGLLLAGSLYPAFRALWLGVSLSLGVQAMIYLAALLAGCMVCHGELFRNRPASRHLTAYYLAIAAGGALGGILVALVAPLVFNGYWEYPIVLAIIGAAAICAWLHGDVFRTAPRWLLPATLIAELLVIGLAISHIRVFNPWTVATERNFYGVLRVMRFDDDSGGRLNLMHGGVLHGSQFIAADRRRLPTMYYGPDSGAGLAFRQHPLRQAGNLEKRALKAGIVGLGTGTLAVYGEPGDLLRFYEINPDVVTIAREMFTFLKDTPAHTELLTGDARLLLEDELRQGKPQQYDLLLVDAFSSDAIPIHLLTRECFAIYHRHLAPNGLLLMHLTNRHLDLVPVVRAQAAAIGAQAALISSLPDEALGTKKADWMVVTSNQEFLDNPVIKSRLTPPPVERPDILWSDDYASLWQILK